MLTVGEKLPIFSLLNHAGEEISSASFQGKSLIIYFYPEDFTPGCLSQAQNFAHLYHEFDRLGYVVLGISKDSVESHAIFKTVNSLPFTLLSDPHKIVRTKFGVLQPEEYDGERIIDTRRGTFVFNAEGILIHRFLDVDPKESTKELLALLSK